MSFREPFELRDQDYNLDSYQPLDPSSVYYDEGMAALDKRMKEYNRVALIIQGLYDRSTVLHPHAPVKSWTAEGFDQAIVLVNDATSALTFGEPPDFEAFRAELNAHAQKESLFVGQSEYWQKREAKKESNRLDAVEARTYNRRRDTWRPKRFKPAGNPGPADPGLCVTISARATKDPESDERVEGPSAVFRWGRKRQGESRMYWRNWRHGHDTETIPCSMAVPLRDILCIDKYELGDFVRFYQDPRTRAQYLRWAPLLLAAEEYRVQNPRKKDWYERF